MHKLKQPMRFVCLITIMLALLRPNLGLAEPAAATTEAQAQTSAKIRGFIISSDELERDNENETMVLKGHVKVVYKTQYFEADNIVIDFKKKQAHLRGKVQVQTISHQIGGEEIILDYEANQGIIYYGYVQSNNVRFQGDLIEQQNLL